MNARPLFFLLFAACSTLLVEVEETHKLAPVKKIPDGLSKKIAPLLSPNGFSVVGPKGPLCDFWLAKSVPVTYKGILPDLFREGKGVVAQGQLGAGGVFRASDVLAKHDENYMPVEAAEAIARARASGEHSGNTQAGVPR